MLLTFEFENKQYQVHRFEKNDKLWYAAFEIASILNIENFDNLVKRFVLEHSEETLDQQKVLTLTYPGICVLLSHSQTSHVKMFQNWLLKTISDKETIDAKKQQERQTKHEFFLKRFHKRYVVYVGFIAKIDGKSLVKIGHTKDLRTSFTRRHTVDYGAIRAVHVRECQLNEQFEAFLLRHERIKKWQYKEPVKQNGGKSNEVFLVTDEQFDEIINIIDCNMNRFQVKTDIVEKLPESQGNTSGVRPSQQQIERGRRLEKALNQESLHEGMKLFDVRFSKQNILKELLYLTHVQETAPLFHHFGQTDFDVMNNRVSLFSRMSGCQNGSWISVPFDDASSYLNSHARRLAKFVLQASVNSLQPYYWIERQIFAFVLFADEYHTVLCHANDEKWICESLCLDGAFVHAGDEMESPEIKTLTTSLEKTKIEIMKEIDEIILDKRTWEEFFKQTRIIGIRPTEK